MHLNVSLIALMAASFGLAMIFGLMAARLRLPPLVGYLLAGLVISPGTGGVVGDAAQAGQLAEIGVMLLMFGVGLHFSVGDLLAVRKIAVPGAVLQTGVATAMGAGICLWWGWSPAQAVVFGLALSVASSVVLLRALEVKGLLDSTNGRIAVGWLAVEDLAMVLVLVLLPALAPLPGGDSGIAGHGLRALLLSVGLTLAKLTAFITLVLVVGKWAFPRVLLLVARSSSRELFSLCVISAAVGVAYGSVVLFDVSFALGAFFAGMMMRASEFSHRAAEDALPLRDAFSVLFFVSVGMLFDPRILLEAPLQVLAVVGIIMVGKTLAAVGLVLAFRYPLNTALTVGASLAQIGEFSFILASLGLSLNLMTAEGHTLIVAGAFVSIALNALLFTAIAPAQAWARARSAWARKLDLRDDPLAAVPMSTDRRLLSGQVVLVGHGRVGHKIAGALERARIHYVVADSNRAVVESLRKRGRVAVSGDASDPIVLVQAHITKARMLVISITDPVACRKMVDIARKLNPGIRTALRAANEDGAVLLRKEGLGEVFVAEQELAASMARHVSSCLGQPSP
ncbi:cation:proton antiporter [Zoogloea sp.]|uniref:cation:proton antiporter n=1 Tax=Zoogloea sp. TaxID=49181 RepID=UPI00262D00EE|nr:cation:proton antiporter [Zoogloea sp.]MDD3353446.1 cation:proton antiporter [Zoogloea sp.]